MTLYNILDVLEHFRTIKNEILG